MTIRWEWQDPGPSHIDAKLLRRLATQVDDVIEGRKHHYIDLLCGLLRHPTVSGAPDPEGQRAYRQAMDDCLQHVANEAERLGMEWRDHDGMAAVAERRGEGEGSLGIAGHLDVVPPGGTWRHPPFSGTVVDGEIWGRGAQDDKGPVAAALAALDILQRLGIPAQKDIRLLLGTLEETDDWPDMDLLLEREEPPDVTLVPDGAFPVIVGEKGIMTIAWSADWEPDAHDVRLVGLSAGERHNVVPPEARVWMACREGPQAAEAVLKEMGAQQIAPAEDPPPAAGDDVCVEGRFIGRAAHGAFPQDGDNAALKALRALGERPGGGPAAFARFLVARCSDLDGAGMDLDESHTHMGDATLNLGIVEMGPRHGHAEVNVRFPVGLTIQDVRRRFEQAADEAEGLHVKAGTRGRPQDPIFVSPEDHPHLIHALQAAYHTATGRKPTLASMAGTTYAKIFPLAMAFGPQDDSVNEPILAHQCDERVTIERFLENIKIYTLAVALLACDEDQVAQALDASSKRPPRPKRGDGRRRSSVTKER